MQTGGDVNETTYQRVKTMFRESGYVIPTVVFWCLRGSANAIPVSKDELGTIMISGFSPNILTGIMSGTIISPFEMMRAAINNERYSRLKLTPDEENEYVSRDVSQDNRRDDGHLINDAFYFIEKMA
jgi:hypothetical protein